MFTTQRYRERLLFDLAAPREGILFGWRPVGPKGSKATPARRNTTKMPSHLCSPSIYLHSRPLLWSRSKKMLKQLLPFLGIQLYSYTFSQRKGIWMHFCWPLNVTVLRDICLSFTDTTLVIVEIILYDISLNMIYLKKKQRCDKFVCNWREGT